MSDLRWHAADGTLHIQATLKGLQGTCGCGYRHRLVTAREDQICPGVAHTWPAGRLCVLCGLGWRVPGATPGAGYLSQAGGPALAVQVIEISPGAFMEIVDAPPARECIYCTSLAGAPEALRDHRASVHA